MENKCIKCSKVFASKKSLEKHLKLVSCDLQGITSKNISCAKCPNCGDLFAQKNVLKVHLEEEHGVKLNEEIKEFTSCKGKVFLFSVYSCFQWVCV